MREDDIRKVLAEQVDPILAEHYGGATLTGVEDDVVYVKFTGACASCSAAADTLEQVVTRILTAAFPEIREVRLDDAVSEELLDLARRLLAKSDAETT